MKRSTYFRLCISALVVSMTGASIPASRATVEPHQAAAEPQSKVIVILRDQLPSAPPARRAMASRTAAIAASQAPLIAGLQQARQRPIHSFGLINAFATSVSAAEAARLAAEPTVRAVVPDMQIREQNHGRPDRGGLTAAPVVGGPKTPEEFAAYCNTLEPQALKLTKTASEDASRPQAQSLLDGHGKPVRGTGVKVAFLADGLDTTIPGFIRHDGSPVFVDYADFSGDPAGTPTAGGEAFGDASSIAAQDDPNGVPLTFDISQFVNAAHPLPSPCNIRIRGVAPGASLVGLKVFSNLGYTTNSSFVQAIDYAVINDDVDVINESFGGNPYPDNANDPISMADDAAVAAGVTVVVSSGDAGSAGTLGSPSTDSHVISAGASTQFRFYAQTGYYALPLSHGFLDDNISSLSSGGFSQATARTVDVVAPGDLGWALCSSNTTLYQDCTNYASTPAGSPIEGFGGTSEAAPLTSAEAALIIQAYRSTHGGANPTPALVRQIIMSTATDLGAPADEQGAGLIDTFAAVKVALSLADANGAPTRHGHGLLITPARSQITDAPNTPETLSYSVTNTGSVTRHLLPSIRKLGKPIAGATVNLDLEPATAPTFIGPVGDKRAYIEKKFTVPAGAAHLDAAIAFQSPIDSAILARLALLDPSGRQAAYSLPQGDSSGYGHVDVVKPAAGTWTAVIFTVASANGYKGPVQFTWAAEQHVPIGTVVPAELDLAPGATGTVTATFNMPAKPGDQAAAIRFNRDLDGGDIETPEIPVSLRSLIPIGPTGGAFTGTLTGGNGRAGVGPTQTFAFDVPAGVNDMSLVLQIPDNGYLLEGLLVDPQGMQLSVGGNLDPFGDVEYALQLSRYAPQPGRWKFVLLQNFYSSGNQTSLPFSARIGFNGAYAVASGLPDSPSATVSASGAPVVATVTVANTGALTEAYFADARTSTPVTVALTAQACAATPTLPGTCGLFYVPTEATNVLFKAQSKAPITMDAFNDVGYEVGFTGSPDIFAKQTAPGNVVASLSVPEVPYGAWIVDPSLVGPYPAAGAAQSPVTTGASAFIQPFDGAVSSTSGDIWADLTLGTNTYNPLVLAPGTAGRISIKIKPDASQVGKVVSGHLYIDTFNGVVGTGDEAVSIPYSYTVTK